MSLRFYVALLLLLSSTTSASIDSYVTDILRSDLIVVAKPLPSEFGEEIDLANPDTIDKLTQQVERIRGKIISVKFDISDVLKGDDVISVNIPGIYVDDIFGYASHDNFEFWLFDGGSCASGDGRQCLPRVVQGKDYLLLLKKTVDGYELIDSPKSIEHVATIQDAWFREVCRVLGGPGLIETK